MVSKNYLNLFRCTLLTTGTGDSGAPVIRVGDGSVIGTHVDGSTQGAPQICSGFNRASPIGGTYGPDYDIILQAIQGDTSQFQGAKVANPVAGVSYVSVS